VLLGGVQGATGAPPGTVTQSGYVVMADGTRLRYTVERPEGPGRFPVAMNYDGYCAGTGATGCNDPHLSAELLDAGYAVLGVNVRGTGCSTGTFDFRDPQASVDGAAVVTWAAQQPWSNGRVGLFGDSFPGLTQPGIAALRPKGLAAIAPFQVVDDVYRDVGYPGGVLNAEFAAFWGLANQPAAEGQNPVRAASSPIRSAPPTTQTTRPATARRTSSWRERSTRGTTTTGRPRRSGPRPGASTCRPSAASPGRTTRSAAGRPGRCSGTSTAASSGCWA
jgi:hypothetical protein